MAVPKKKTSKSKRDSRKSNWKRKVLKKLNEVIVLKSRRLKLVEFPQ